MSGMVWGIKLLRLLSLENDEVFQNILVFSILNFLSNLFFFSAPDTSSCVKSTEPGQNYIDPICDVQEIAFPTVSLSTSTDFLSVCSAAMAPYVCDSVRENKEGGIVITYYGSVDNINLDALYTMVENDRFPDLLGLPYSGAYLYGTVLMFVYG